MFWWIELLHMFIEVYIYEIYCVSLTFALIFRKKRLSIEVLTLYNYL